MGSEKIDPIEILLFAFGEYLQENLGELTQVLNEFPTPNIELQYPSITLDHGQPQFQAEMPYELSLGTTDKVTNQANLVWICGQYDLTVQADLWTRSAPERNLLYARFMRAFNNQINPMGLSLKLNDYYGLYARLDVSGFQHMDDEQSSQREEWRTKVSILATLKYAQEQLVPIITKPIVTEFEIVDNIP